MIGISDRAANGICICCSTKSKYELWKQKWQGYLQAFRGIVVEFPEGARKVF
jgi:hypothetical protein